MTQPNLLTTIQSIKWIDTENRTIFEYYESDCVQQEYSEIDCRYIFESIGFLFSLENKNRIIFFSKFDQPTKRFIFHKFIHSLRKFHKYYKN
jgi:hypothetical protein